MVARTIDFAADAMGARLLEPAAAGLRANGLGARTWRGATIDSRTITGDELFFALPGSRVDGHDYAPAALASGAAAVVVHRDVRDPAADPEGGAWLLVDDTMEALHALTRAVRDQVPEHLVSITGSSGKTTTKELLAAMLARRFRVARSPGNFNNLIGFPLALLSIDDESEWMVAEMGMSTPRELGGVARLGRPEIAVYTNVRPVHLENFDSLRGIAEAKAEMLEGLVDGGLIVANADDPEVLRIARRHAEATDARLVTYGVQAADVDVRGVDLRTLAEEGIDRPGSRFRLIARDPIALGSTGLTLERTIDLGVHGLYNVENALAAAAAALVAGVSLDDVAEAASAFRPARMRGEVHRLASGTLLVDDSYNSNPDAARRALESAARLVDEATPRLAVLGDMLELGPTAESLHREVGRRAAELGFDVLGVGPLARHLVEAARDGDDGDDGDDGGGAAHHVDTAEDAVSWLRAHGPRGDALVLVKGSRGVGLEVAVEALLAADADRPMTGEAS